MTGTVAGGWNFVWAAYGLTTLILGIYTLSVYTRYRRARMRDERDERMRSEGER